MIQAMKMDPIRHERAAAAVYGKLHASLAIETPWDELKRRAKVLRHAEAFVIFTECHDLARVAVEGYARRDDRGAYRRRNVSQGTRGRT